METVTSNTQDTQHSVRPSEEEVRSALRTLLIAIGEDPDREGLKDTPDRIMRMWQEIFRGYQPEKKPRITTFANTNHLEEMVFDAGDYYSMCEHHVLPFFGQYYFAYIPSPEGRILGISKVARVVGYCAARLQLQERLAEDIIAMLSDALKGKALGFALMLRGRHLCKTMRGVRNKGEMAVTLYTGQFKTNRSLRLEFLKMVDTVK
ncbi:MAG: GTP cyclohydrolase I [Bacteroidales bacterium]|nr:GTP cyclohydrolase I [Candidatus Physcousia equi]